MPMPAVLSSVVGQSGTVIWTPDWMQVPFVMSIGICGNSSGANGTAQIDYNLFDVNSVDVNGLSTSNIATSWVNVVAAAAFTSQMTVTNFTTPCQAIRLNVLSATATTQFTVVFLQATFPR